MENIIVKNFGPLKNIDMEIKNLTVFIGESGTGKSILAKLISIFKNSAGGTMLMNYFSI